ncbi:MAG: hypothetical protein Q9M24_04970 [Mariprofundaceae bacterium]|nr:hypothetical protein [Mariprofundaceae bacterium]
MDYINLNRSFVPISKDHEFNEDDFDYAFLFDKSRQVRWSNILELKRVVILAESGVGKTEEIRATTERIRGIDEYAFFLRLEHLCDDFETSFEVGNINEYNDWLTSDTPAWFFLDSVDEARMHGPKKFETAIRKLSLQLGEHKQRARICITSRPSEWRAKSDMALLKSQLSCIEVEATSEQQNPDAPASPYDGLNSKGHADTKGEPKLIEPSVFGIQPLTQEQKKRFSETFGVQNLSGFFDAIEKAEADIFSDTPQDLIELIGYWNANGRISNRSEMFKVSITSKLKETDPDRESAFPLSGGDAFYAAKRLASAATFLRKNRILVPDQNQDAAIKSEAIDTQSILSQWSSDQCRALLLRSIFDEAIYGAVRFHHRSVREYLTAQWLYDLLESGKSRRSVETLFFSEQYGEQVSIPFLRPVLSWLILWDDRIREKAARISPEVFIQGGDPSALPTEIRQFMLESFCEFHAEQNCRHLSFDISEVRRFAHPDLGQTIDELMGTYADNEAILELLFRMVWQGEIDVCMEKIINYAMDKNAGRYTRIYAIHSLASVGSKDQKNMFVKSVISDSTLNDDKIIGEIISAFAPDYLNIEGLVTLLRRIIKQDRHSYSMIDHPLEEFLRYKCPEKDLIQLIRSLIPPLKQEPVVERRYFEISQTYSWLLPFAAQAAERLVRANHADALDRDVLEVISLAQAARSFGDYRSGHHSLDKLVPENKELNKALFWFDVGLARKHLDKKKGERLTGWWQINTLDGYWYFTSDDFETLLEDVRTKENGDDRLVALTLAFSVYKESGRRRARRLALWKSAKGNPELEKTLHSLLHPPAMTKDQLKWQRSYVGYDRRQKQRREKEADNRRQWKNWLHQHTDTLRDTSIASKGSVWHAAEYLMDVLRNQTEDHGNWAQSHWEGLIHEFGVDVAKAFRDGCIDYWRKYIPEIRSEGMDNPNSIPHAVIVGLSGLEMEAGYVPDWPVNLTESEAQLASQYAMREINGFPEWMQNFHRVFPSILEARILKEIEWEFSQYDGKEPCHYVLSDITGLDWIKSKLSNPLLQLLKIYEPKHNQTVEHALEVVLATTKLDKKGFADLAKTKIGSAQELSRQALWLAAWTCVDAQNAIKKLTTLLNQLEDPDQTKILAMLFITYLLGDRGGSSLSTTHKSYLKVSVLHSLIKLMHTYIHHSEDIDRSGGGAYTPGLRDNAQDARDLLFRLLKEISGKETYLAMVDLAKTHPNERAREWYRIQAKQRAESDAEPEAWCANDITSFADEAERTPKNHRELYDLVVSRLLDLKYDLEGGDSSNAGLLKQSHKEVDHRIFIGGWLRDHSKNRYAVPQEEEMADAKKPDIRIHQPSIDAPVPIELKIADNWSGAILLERLENQLCGQYLRDARSNCGIFLLTFCGKKHHWEHPATGKNLDFAGLIRLLKARAIEIEASNSKIESIWVIGIDLTKRKIKRA